MLFNDEQIIAAILSGNDHKALEFLYKKILPVVISYVKKNGGNKDDAFDIFQDGITVFVRYVVERRFDKKYDIQGFVFTICKNCWINKVKRDKKITRIGTNFDIAEDESFLNHIINEERENLVVNLIAQLGDRCRELLTMAYFNQLQAKEICEKLGFANEDAVKTKKYKCKQRLLEIIGQSSNILEH